jgi:pimeloyl-ACP methyl ester carboxylesterase
MGLMATFVLVHGAWGGAHGFHLVRPLLQEHGHAVFTPSLTGIGERSHLTGPQITLSTHVRDVVNHILYEDLSDIVLLGFSYGGMVVTGALDHIGDRVRHLVYLDAFVPLDGQAVTDLTGRADPGFGLGAPWSMPPTDRDYEDPAEGQWSNERRSVQPIGTFTDPVHLSRPLEEWPFTRTYVKALGDPRLADRPNAFYDAGDRAKASSAWRYLESTSNHMIPNNRPAELAALLLELT